MIGMAVSLFLLALSIALYPIYKRPAILYYSIFGTVLAILCFGFSYWVDSKKNKTVFKMDGNGVYYCDEDHDKIAAFDLYMDKFIKAMDEGKE